MWSSLRKARLGFDTSLPTEKMCSTAEEYASQPEVLADSTILISCWMATQSMDSAAEYLALEVNSTTAGGWIELARITSDDDENTGDEICTNLLKIVFAIPVPTTERITIYPKDSKLVSVTSKVVKKSVKAKTIIAGISINKKLPAAGLSGTVFSVSWEFINQCRCP